MIEIKWQAADGYVGKSRPHSFRIYPEDYEDYEDDEDIVAELYILLQEDFLQKVSPEFTDDIDEIVARIKEALTE